MDEKKNITEIVIALCERLGIEYHFGNGVSTLNGEPYDLENEPGPFLVEVIKNEDN